MHSALTLTSITPRWAAENKQALAAALRDSLALRPEETLTITDIISLQSPSVTRRGLQSSSGVVVKFVVGTTNQQLAAMAQTKLNKFASGDQTQIALFASNLDAQLKQRGKGPIGLDATTVTFQRPVIQHKMEQMYQAR